MKRVTLFIIAAIFTTLSLAQNITGLELCVLADGKSKEEIAGFFSRKEWKLDSSSKETDEAFGKLIYSHKATFGAKNSTIEVLMLNGSAFMAKYKCYNNEDYDPIFNSFDSLNFKVESLTIEGEIMISRYTIDNQEIRLLNKADKSRSGRIKFSKNIELDEPNIVIVAPKGYLK